MEPRTPPADDDPQRVDDTGEIELVDTDLGQPNDAPEAFVEMTQAGTWNMTPVGGPYNAMSGQLTVVEILDGDTLNPLCDVVIALVGTTVTTNSCTACDDDNHVFDVTLTATQGSETDCHDPDLNRMMAAVADPNRPLPQLGYSSATSQILYNWNGTGQWLPWYDATRIADQVSFSWTATLGFSPPEED